MDVTQFSMTVMKNVREFIQPALDALAFRVDDGLIGLREEFNAKFAAIPLPENGKDTNPVVIESADIIKALVEFPELLDAAVQNHAETNPAQAGKDADPEVIAAQVRDAVAAIKLPEIDSEAVTASIKALVDAIPPAADGSSVTLADVEPMIEQRMATWALDFERRAHDVLQRSIDRMPAPKDGADGLGFDDLSVDYDGERGFSMKFTRGEVIKAFEFTLPVVIYREVFRDDAEYAKSDSVTFGGSLFIAMKDAPQGKPGSSDDWKLAVKHGRHGKDGDPGKDYTPPQPVKLT